MELEELREKYSNPRLQLLKPNKRDYTIIKTAYDIEKIMKTNESWEVNFKISSIDSPINQNSCQMYIKIPAPNESDYYIIKEVNINTEDKTVFDVKCLREEESLKQVFDEVLKEVGKTPEQLFNAIKSSCKACDLNYYWKGTDAPSNKLRSIVTTDENSVWDNLLLLCEAYDGWMEITTDENTFNRYIFLRTNPIETGLHVKNGLSYKALDINFSTKNIITRMAGYGAKSNLTDREINIMSVNPTGNVYIQDTSYFEQVLGMSKEDILKDVNCLQEATFRDSNIDNEQELYNATLEQLHKKSQPEITGNLTYKDIYVFNTGYEEGIKDMQIGWKINVIDTDINYAFSTIIKTVSKRYTGDIMSTPLEISNIIPYSNPIKDIVNSVQTVSRITDKTTDGSPYISTITVKDENGESAKTKFKNAFARIETNEKEIVIIVGDVADHESRITVLQEQIVLRVTKEEMWSEIALYPARILMAVNDEDNETSVEILPGEGLLVHNGKISIYNTDDELMMQGNTKGSLTVREGFEIGDFDGTTYTEYNKDGINFYRDEQPIIGFHVNEDDNLEFLGECEFNNNADFFSLSVQGTSLDDYIRDIIANG